MTEDELKSVLAAYARDFANSLIELIRNAPLEEIAELQGVDAPESESNEAESPNPAPETRDENELSILEHLNSAGPTGSTLRAWIISTHGELEPDEHKHWEDVGQRAFDALLERGVVTSKQGGPARGTVYSLAPTS